MRGFMKGFLSHSRYCLGKHGWIPLFYSMNISVCAPILYCVAVKTGFAADHLHLACPSIPTPPYYPIYPSQKKKKKNFLSPKVRPRVVDDCSMRFPGHKSVFGWKQQKCMRVNVLGATALYPNGYLLKVWPRSRAKLVHRQSYSSNYLPKRVQFHNLTATTIT